MAYSLPEYLETSNEKENDSMNNGMNNTPRLTCPQCGSINVSVQVFQEQAGTTTVSKTKSKYKEKGHGCLWWLLIGWWWWMVDLLLWIFLFLPRLLIQIFKKKKYVGSSQTVSQTVNQTVYKSMCNCMSCGYVWEGNRIVRG